MYMYTHMCVYIYIYIHMSRSQPVSRTPGAWKPGVSVLLYTSFGAQQNTVNKQT